MRISQINKETTNLKETEDGSGYGLQDRSSV